MTATPSGVIVIAASAGGHPAVVTILAALPLDFPLPVLIVQHLVPDKRSYLATMLGKRTKLPVAEVSGEQPVRGGHVYTAPPDHHLVVRSLGVVTVSRADKIHFTRPAADLLFTSAATHWRSSTVGIVLSGYGRDGSLGAQSIRDAGGVCIAQDPATAMASQMPAAAIETGAVDLVLSPLEIAPALIAFATVPGIAAWFHSNRIGLPPRSSPPRQG